MIRGHILLLPPLALAAAAAFAQSRTMTLAQGPHRMEMVLELRKSGAWQVIDPGLVLAEGDEVRFRFRTNFEGYLYVSNLGSSGAYQQLFPQAEIKQDNHLVANREYLVPGTGGDFKIAGPPGYETVYWLVTPGRVTDAPPAAPPPPPERQSPAPSSGSGGLMPRCDDTIWRARGDCVDNSAGPKLVPRGEQLPDPLAGPGEKSTRDLQFSRQKDKAVISSPVPLTGPVLYQFRLAHK